ncbi:MAG: transcriptional regulator [Clostridia bacterium]|nr:transcriptional regulator [Clostridia bacterium]
MKRYEKILTLKVFSVEDVYNLTGNINTAKSIIRNLLLFGYIKRVKHNLYVVCNIEFKNTIPDQYMIASKIKDDAYISYHSALEYYGVKNQIFYEVYVSTKKRFTNFEFEGISYKFINSKYNFGIIQDDKVRITDKERTLIDCIEKTELAGGNEELIMCLELLGRLNGEKILKYLGYYNSNKLYAKVGFFLELYKEHYGVKQNVIEECRKKCENKKLYFNEETKRMKSKYIKEWNLIVPKIFTNKGEELYW